MLKQLYDFLIKISTDKTKKIYIRGAGIQGQNTLVDLIEMGITVSAYIDNDPEKQKNLCSGLPVYAPQWLYHQDSNDYYVLCAMMNPQYYAQARKEMMINGLEENIHFIDISFPLRTLRKTPLPARLIPKPSTSREARIFNNAYRRKREAHVSMPKNFPAPVLPTSRINDGLASISLLNVWITTACTLRCRDCLHMMPHYKSTSHEDVEVIINNLRRITNVSHVHILEVLGGETFLHPNLLQILEGIATLSNIDQVQLITNETILPDMEVINFLKKNPKFLIRLSNYNGHTEFPSALDDNQQGDFSKLDKLCHVHRLNHLRRTVDYSWTDFTDDFRHRGYSKDDVKHLFDICGCATSGLTLYQGKLYICFRMISPYGLNIIPLNEDSSRDYLVLADTSDEDLRDSIVNFYYDTDYLTCCYYCDGSHYGSRKVIPNQQIKKQVHREMETI
ncbi:MAG: radical SAM protein [Defluviitaleaceae bacterium]|nr:radical SAM protein [Defluviitaleaceae bacterium]MCL2239577.1 radical SAM protein [Defluviitaleaceae bacterium]